MIEPETGDRERNREKDAETGTLTQGPRRRRRNKDIETYTQTHKVKTET